MKWDETPGPAVAIAAVDPGKTTGIAAWGLASRSFQSWETDCWNAVREIEEGVRRHRIERVVCERFDISKRTLRATRGNNWSLESIGALRYICMRFETPFVLQSAADGKSFSTDAKLKAIGWYRPSEGGHANDAARHLLVSLIRNDELPATELMKLEEL